MSQSKTQSRKSYIGLLLLTTCAFVAQGALTAAAGTSYGENELHKDSEFRALVKRPAFFVGSRYGRSSGNGATGAGASTTGVGTSKTRRLIIVPRNDRFFLGSRYGKRSDEYLSPYEQNSLGFEPKASLRDAETAEEHEKVNSGAGTTMSCAYTGLSNFYRCRNINREELNHIMSRNDDNEVLDSNSVASEDTNINTK